MKVLYFGSDVFLPCFEYFLQDHEIAALYTYHNKEDYFTEYSIVNLAKQRGIPVHYEPITAEEITRYFTEEHCELLFVAEYNRILPLPDDLPSFRGINTHSSLLPQGRSYYPIEAAMDRNLPRTGVTMHKLSSKLDKGDILAQRSIEITDDLDSIDIYLYCAFYAREMIEDIAQNLDKYWEAAIPQTADSPYWKRPQTENLILDHTMNRSDALQNFRKYNAMTQVLLGNTWFYITALEDGIGPMNEDIRFLSPFRVLYKVKDGHLRLHILPMEENQ